MPYVTQPPSRQASRCWSLHQVRATGAVTMDEQYSPTAASHQAPPNLPLLSQNHIADECKGFRTISHESSISYPTWCPSSPLPTGQAGAEGPAGMGSDFPSSPVCFLPACSGGRKEKASASSYQITSHVEKITFFKLSNLQTPLLVTTYLLIQLFQKQK